MQLINNPFSQKNSRRLWRSRRRKSSSVPAGAADFPAALFLAGKCPHLGRDSISRCRKKSGNHFFQQRRNLPETFPVGNFGQPQPYEFSDFCYISSFCTVNFISLELREPWNLVAQCSATPATVAATPLCSATPFQTQISVRHPPARGGEGGATPKCLGGCSATPVLHLQNAIIRRPRMSARRTSGSSRCSPRHFSNCDFP